MNHIYSRSEKHKITVRWEKGPFGLKKMFTVDLLIKSIIGSIIYLGCRIGRGVMLPVTK